MLWVRAVVLTLAAVLAATPACAENVLRWASAVAGLTLDPHALNHSPTIAQNLEIYEPLVDIEYSDYKLQPALAVRWWLVDPTTWEFALREGVRFHDGTPFTTADVVFSLRRALAETSRFADELPPIVAVEAAGEHAVRIRTAAPSPILPVQLSVIFIMSERWAERHGATTPAPYADAEIAYVERHANGTGPFIVEAYEPGVRTALIKNPDWWGLTERAPHNIDRVELSVIADPAQRVAALLAGEIDFLHDPPFAELDRLASTPGVRLEQALEFRTIHLGLDQASPELRSSNVKGSNPFKDRRVRQAVYQAIDIEAIRRDVMHGYAVPAGVLIQPRINGYAPELDVRLLHDPERARALLVEAGYPDGFAVTLDCPNDRYRNDAQICRAVVAMLGRIGIAVTPQIGPMREHVLKIQARRTDFYMLGVNSTGFDAHWYLAFLYRSDGLHNVTGYADPEVDRLIDAIGTELATYVRDALIEQVWRRVLAEVVYVPLHHQVLVWALRENLELPIDAFDAPRFHLARFRGSSSGLSP
jgi:peptide/nickel transport system substrate-binding protein